MEQLAGLTGDLGVPTRATLQPVRMDREGLSGLRATIDAAPIGIAHFDLDGRFMLVNAELCRILGFTRDELLARTFQEITFPDDLAACIVLTERLTSGAIPSYAIDKRFVRRDGAAVWSRVSVSAVRDADASVAFFVGVAEDLTAERASEQKFSVLANGISQMAWISDGEGRRSWYNERWYEFTGLSFEELRGHGWHQMHHPDHFERVRDGQLACFAAGEIWEDTVPLRRKDGIYRWFLSRAMPVRDDAGRIAHWFGTNTDITELRSARLQAERAVKLRDEMVAIVAHDLRNPLQTIAVAAAALERLTLTGEARSRLLAMLHRTTRSMDRLLSDLLDISGMEAGSFAITRAPVDLHALLAESCEQFAERARERGIELTCHVDAELPPVSGDRDRLAQVLSNLLGNSLKFTPVGGHISLSATRLASGVEVAVVDDGPGVAAEELPRVFDRFWRADAAAKTGAGLGLAIAKGIMDAHGGSISAESVPGRGMTMRLLIPCANPVEPG
jgi:PAS domain S-box-containing protein